MSEGGLVRAAASGQVRIGALVQTIAFAEALAMSSGQLLTMIIDRASMTSAVGLQFQLDTLETEPVAVGRPRLFRPFSMELDTNLLQAAGNSIYTHVATQIPLLVQDRQLYRIAEAWLAALEPSGWVSATVDEIAHEATCSPKAALHVLTMLQNVEPSGLFARSLRECLLLQLKASDELSPSMEKLLDHLPLLGQGRMAELVSLCGTDHRGLAAMVVQLRGLDPKPGSSFSCERPQTRAPDLVLQYNDETGWDLRFHHWLRPLVSVRMLEGKKVARKIREANAFLQLLERRDRIIMDIARTVFDVQEAFMLGKQPYPAVVTLKQVASCIGLHETTVGRIRSHLIIGTERGGLRLSELFQQGVRGKDGAVHSIAEVKYRMSRLLKQEDSACPLTDARLVEHLAKDGIKIARRTVAKYRQELGVPSVSERNGGGF